MYMTHTFAHRETLSRAHSWLTRFGFHPRQIEAEASGIPRIVLVDEPHRLAAAKMLINVAEHADPDGYPSLWNKVPRPHFDPTAHRHDNPLEPHKPHSSVLGWHPLD